MAETEDNIYIPKNKIVLAFSFEGIVNDGATECALVAYNAYQNIKPGMGLDGRVVEPREFDEYVDRDEIKGFLSLRPLINKAYEYFFVIDTLKERPEEAERVVYNPTDIEAFDVLIETFREIDSKTPDEQKKMLDDAFYKERKRMQNSDYEAWLNVQRPFPESIAQLRYLVRTQMFDDEGNVVSGFVPWYATSKDEASTFSLCENYAKHRKLDPDDIEADLTGCTIPRKRILGRERVPSRNEIERLNMIAEIEDVYPEMVWRINDRYDSEAQERLFNAGYKHQFLVPGYTFPHDFENAKKDDRIIVIENREEMARDIGKYAQKLGL